MLRLVLASFAVVATGCQGFVGIDDVAGHLPFVEGEYLIGLQRVRADGTTQDTVRLRGTASIDRDSRTLSLSLSQLAADDGRTLSENAISGLVFPDDATAVDFDLSIEIQPDATMPPTGAADTQVGARMRMKLEGDYALCATPADGAPLPTIGSVLVDSEVATPAVAAFDVACDDL